MRTLRGLLKFFMNKSRSTRGNRVAGLYRSGRKTMLKRLFKAAAIATSASFLAVAAQAADVIKIGQVAPKSGPLAGGAAVTQ